MGKNTEINRTQVDVGFPWGKLEFTDWMDESMSWKETCYIGDWSWLDEFHAKGPDAIKLFSDLCGSSFAKFDIGQAKHVVMCSRKGKVIGEGILMRFAEDEVEFQTRGPGTTWLEFNVKKGRYNVTTDCTISKFKLHVQGPKSPALLEKLTGESLRDIKFMYFRTSRIKGRDVFFLRQGMAGEIGYELQGPNSDKDTVFDAIMEAGKEFGIRRLGSRTAMINHLEACFPTITHDYIPAVADEPEYYEAYNVKVDDDRSPLWFRSFERCTKVKGSFDADDISAWHRSPVELGWAKNIKFDHDFHGREALEAEVSNPKRTIVTLVWNLDDVMDVWASVFRDDVPYDFMDMPRGQWFVMYANSVMKGDRLVGVTSSRGFSRYFQQMLSLCTIDIEHSKPGTEVTVVWGDPGHRKKLIRATVAPAPYKEDKRKIDVSKV